MAFFERDDVRIYYEEHGSGFPILLIAPGGMRSTLSMWDNTPWNPISELSPRYRVIAMDQRNAGRSTAPIRPTDGWHVYTEDQLALLDHLGVDRFAVAGMCIGGPYIMGLIKAAPSRVAAAVIFQTIGKDGNEAAFYEMFEGWADGLRPDRPEVDETTWATFAKAMYEKDFVFNATREEVAAMSTPMLVLMGNDHYHPQSVSRELARLAPNAELIEHWKEPRHHEAAKAAVAEFLARHAS